MESRNGVDESRPLLGNGGDVNSGRGPLQDEEAQPTSPGGSLANKPPTPLPWKFFLVLFTLNAAQPLCFDLIFPFVNQMIVEIGVVDDPEKVGFYSGLIESLFQCMTFIMIMPCNFLSDHYGRKPIILVGITFMSISIFLFGFSKSLWLMIVTRCLAGMGGSSWSTMRIVVAELTDRSNQAAGYSGLTISYRLGQILGQPLGGYLAHPERSWPSVFSAQIWHEYPFALPGIVAAVFGILAVIWAIFSLPETSAVIKAKKARARRLKAAQYGSVASSPTPSTPSTPHPEGYVVTPVINIQEAEIVVNRPPLMSILTVPVISLFSSMTTMVLVSECLYALYPLFAFTPIHSGGLGVSEATIGTHMAVRAVIHIVTLFAYTPLLRCFGGSNLKLYQTAMAFWALTIILLPYMNFLARQGATGGEDGIGSAWFNFVLFVFFLIWSIASLCWTTSGLLINDSAPSPEALAAINGLSQMAIALPEAIAPAFATSFFAYSIQSGILGGHLIWVSIFVLACLSFVHSLTLKEPTHDWRVDYKNLSAVLDD